ncbi:type IV secretion system protein VirB8 [Duganella sp. FT134W]|uniref:Type IV secretion system protein VirB8 n=1 Tax=Duganella margarita TaxID=2692170 RepID=A0A7X4H398_9BURK|nr:type IV secretion system protein [Duganella margarita]MYM73951.1 type IV secretion system protein VirB8 [Duganella margarita]
MPAVPSSVQPATLNSAPTTRQMPAWEVLIDHQLQRSERRAWWVATVASSVALTAVVALAVLAPYRRDVPYLLALDRVQGNVEFIGTIDDRTIRGYQEVLDKHWVQQYIVARESYFYRLLQDDYDTVLELSETDVGRDFMQTYEGPAARDKQLGEQTEIQIKIVSIQLASNAVGQQATVRFSRTLRHLDTNLVDPVQYAIATLAYSYRPRMFGKELSLIRNPLGFKVSVYRVANELAPVTVKGDRSATGQNGE